MEPTQLVDDPREINVSSKNTRQENRIKVQSVDEFRKLNSYFRQRTADYHTYSLPEERKVCAVLRSIPKELDIEEVKANIYAQRYPISNVRRMFIKGTMS